MRPLLVGYSDLDGGAARATYRIHQAIRGAGIDSVFAVRKRSSQNPAVQELRGWRGLSRPLGVRVEAYAARRLQGKGSDEYLSANLLPTRWAPQLNGDVVNLHWIGAGTLSIRDVGRIRAPLVITMHDMWGFCGVEHYTRDDPDARWVTGYTRGNRPAGRHGLDLDRWTWQRKRRHWRSTDVVAPSRWLADCASRSALMAGWPVHVIPNALDPTVFRPKDRVKARRDLAIPVEATVVLFGAPGGGRDPRKGFDLLRAALRRIAAPAATAIIFGGEQPARVPEAGQALRWMGTIEDDEILASLYSAADVMVVPSRQEAFGQTASEAQACGTPVVAFSTTGLTDAVAHKTTGYLAEPFSTDALAQGISWVLENTERRVVLGRAARERAVRLWSPSVVALRYLEVYELAIQRHQRRTESCSTIS